MGVGRYYENLLRSWARQTLPFEQVTMFSPARLRDLPDDAVRDERFEVEVLPSYDSGVWWQLSRLRPRASGIDLLLAPYTLPVGYRGRAVVSNHGILEGENRVPGAVARARSWHFRYSAMRADAVIVNTTTTAAELVRYYGIPQDKITVVWPGMDERFRPGPHDEEDLVTATAERVVGSSDPFFLFVGKLSSRRHLPELLEAFAAGTAGRPGGRSYHLVLAGPTAHGPHRLQRPVEHIAADLGVSDRVHHFEHLGVETLRLLYRGARALLMTSSKESFSRPVAEAMTSGCPTLVLKKAPIGVTDYIEENTPYRAGEVLVEAADGSVGGLQGPIERLAEDDEFCALLRQRALDSAQSLPDPDEQARRVMTLLADVARGQPPSR